MLAKVITDHRFRFKTDNPLQHQGEIKISMTVDNGLVGDISFAVRDNDNRDVLTKGIGGVSGLPLSTGPTGTAAWSFDPTVLNGSGYVVWNIWVNDPNAAEKQFTVTVNVGQNGQSLKATVTAVMDPGALVAGVGVDGLLIP